jgi:hypothetical protein
VSDPRTGTSPRVRWIAVAATGVAVVATAVVVAAVLSPRAGNQPAVSEPSQAAAAADPQQPAASQAGRTGPSSGTVFTAPGGRPALSTARPDPTPPGDGTWVVGQAAAGHVIVSGTYETTVPAGPPGCTWSRVAMNHTIITTGHASAGQHATVTVEPTDGLFTTRGCGEWSRTG